MNDEESKPWWRVAWSGLWMTAAAFIVFELFIRAIAFFHPIYDVEMMKYAKALKVFSPVPTLIRQHRPNSKAHLMGVDVSLNSLGHRSRELINPKPAPGSSSCRLTARTSIQSSSSSPNSKRLLRKAEERTVEATWRRIGKLLDQFPPKECANYLRNSGYASV